MLVLGKEGKEGLPECALLQRDCRSDQPEAEVLQSPGET